MPTFHFQHSAMATRFEAWIAGDDDEHLGAVAASIWDEVDRIEQRLSRFSPSSEIWRINHAPVGEAILLDVELCEVLGQCLTGWQHTGGYFDVTVGQGSAVRGAAHRLAPAFALNESTRKLVRTSPLATIDLGGYAKGYALDRLRAILNRHAIESALLSAGTSSILALGGDANGQPWSIALRDPFVENNVLEPVSLWDCSLSCSTSYRLDQTISDLIDPTTERALPGQAGCVVVAPTGGVAEILSTACLCMGRTRAAEYTQSRSTVDLSLAGREFDEAQVGWIAKAHDDSRTNLEWLN